MIIYLIGITGVGKSTVGKKIASKLGFSFVDLDAFIEMRNKMRIDEIFKISEDAFRICESKSLKQIKNNKNVVVATGGGIVERSENIDYMKNNGIIILLERPLESILETINLEYRPMLKENKQNIYKLYEKRKFLYNDIADLIYKSDGYINDIDTIVNDIEMLNYRRKK